jgi:hypothetical protein
MRGSRYQWRSLPRAQLPERNARVQRLQQSHSDQSTLLRGLRIMNTLETNYRYLPLPYRIALERTDQMGYDARNLADLRQ